MQGMRRLRRQLVFSLLEQDLRVEPAEDICKRFASIIMKCYKDFRFLGSSGGFGPQAVQEILAIISPETFDLYVWTPDYSCYY